MNKYIEMNHGDGGSHTNNLIKDIFYKHFGTDKNHIGLDAAVFEVNKSRLAFTTDSFVIKPIFFPGGDIGKLSVCGTINDLAAVGAIPLYLSTGFIIEEGFPMEELNMIAYSIGKTCEVAGIKVVTGDTKVVEKGFADGLYINTSGIGIVENSYMPRPLHIGDEIIITGSIAEHGTAIFIERLQLDFQGDIQSDCQPLCSILSVLHDQLQYIKLMKDPTRGGLANAVCEIAGFHNKIICLEEEKIPINNITKAIHQMLGTDPLFFACEGRMIIFADKGYGERIVKILQQNKQYQGAQIIGTVAGDNPQGLVYMLTPIGGKRILTVLNNPMLPRIC